MTEAQIIAVVAVAWLFLVAVVAGLAPHRPQAERTSAAPSRPVAKVDPIAHHARACRCVGHR